MITNLSENIRTFIAANINDTILNEIGKAQEHLENIDCDVKWVKTTNVHLTLKFLGENKSNIYDLKKENKKENISFDKTDIEILKALNEDGRVKIIDIANNLKANPETVLYKLKRLQKEDVIIGNRIQFNMSKFGFHYSLILLNIKNMNKEKEKNLIQFFRKHLFINSYGLFLNNPNCFFQVFHKTEEELRNTLIDFEKLMDNTSYEIDIIPLMERETEEINTLPFY